VVGTGSELAKGGIPLVVPLFQMDDVSMTTQKKPSSSGSNIFFPAFLFI
jgi:hypothetical protein